jgi:hypothetical protein
METIISLFVLLTGLLVRLAIPIGVTVIMAYFLHKLDVRWQAEAQRLPAVEKQNCWELKGCTLEQRNNCIASQSLLPCWQVYRLPNGYLREECISCAVFRNAPVPA